MEIGQVATAVYFGWFIVIYPVVGLLENTLSDLGTSLRLTLGDKN